MSLPVRLSVVCLSVTFVRHPQRVETFGNISMPFGTLAILRRSSQGNPSDGDQVLTQAYFHVHSETKQAMLSQLPNP